MSGKTIEILNTDAEGRLLLADALTYARQLGCTHLVDSRDADRRGHGSFGPHHHGRFRLEPGVGGQSARCRPPGREKNSGKCRLMTSIGRSIRA